MSKIAVYEFKPFSVRFRDRLRGTITMPREAKVLYLGAGPPKGNLMAFCEVSSIHQLVVDTIAREYTILTLGDEVPPGHEYREPLFANPILFVFELVDPEAYKKAVAAEPPPMPKVGQVIQGGKR